MEEEFWKFGCPSNPPAKLLLLSFLHLFASFHPISLSKSIVQQICRVFSAYTGPKKKILVHFQTPNAKQSEFPILSPRLSRYKALTVMSCRDTEIRDRSMFLCLEAIRIPESQPFLLRVFLILQIYTPKTRMRKHQRVRSFKKKQLLVAWFHTKKTHVQPNHFSIQHGLRMTFQFFPICIGANFSCLDKYCLGWKQIMFQLETIPFSKIETGKNHLQSLLFNPLQIVWMVFE